MVQFVYKIQLSGGRTTTNCVSSGMHYSFTYYLVGKEPCSDLVCLKIYNIDNVQDKVVGISLRRNDQLKTDVVWDVFGKVIQSNTRFGLTDPLDLHLDHLRMPFGNVTGAEKGKGRPLTVLSAIKMSTVIVKAALLCLAHALVMALARVNGDPMYKSYSNGYLLDEPVECLLKASGVHLSNRGGLEELQQFQEYLSECKIIVYGGLSPDRLIFTGNSVSSKKLYLLYNADTGHYNVITNNKAAMAKRYFCDVSHFIRQYI
jgi:hypothetical protein